MKPEPIDYFLMAMAGSLAVYFLVGATNNKPPFRKSWQQTKIPNRYFSSAFGAFWLFVTIMLVKKFLFS